MHRCLRWLAGSWMATGQRIFSHRVTGAKIIVAELRWIVILSFLLLLPLSHSLGRRKEEKRGESEIFVQKLYFMNVTSKSLDFFPRLSLLQRSCFKACILILFPYILIEIKIILPKLQLIFYLQQKSKKNIDSCN